MSQETRHVYPDADVLARAAAVDLLRRAQQSVAARGVFTLSLAGGSTPRKPLLPSSPTIRPFADFPWARTQLFFGDERHVPPDHKDSNYLMVSDTLLKSGLVPAANIHRVGAELTDADMAAHNYEVEMQSIFSNAMRSGGLPPLLTPSFSAWAPTATPPRSFPAARASTKRSAGVIANWVEKFNSSRITFTFPVLNAAEAVLLLVAGADKADMLHEGSRHEADDLPGHAGPAGPRRQDLDAGPRRRRTRSPR